MTPSDLNAFLEDATVPKHSAAFMRVMSGGESFRIGPYLFVAAQTGFWRSATRSRAPASRAPPNRPGTLAMARTVDSATAQFFINVVDNSSLNHRDKTPQGYGYAVFGKASKGMNVGDKISAVKTGTQKGFRDVPETSVVVKSMKVLS